MKIPANWKLDATPAALLQVDIRGTATGGAAVPGEPAAAVRDALQRHHVRARHVADAAPRLHALARRRPVQTRLSETLPKGTFAV